MSELDLTHIAWRKSSRSTGSGSDCVEVALGDISIAIRDSKNPQQAFLLFGRTEWKAFLEHVRGRDL
ncbi:DUF397 domain-containing protein [Sphaerisporangium sp. NPDC051011]|uniref:DUF397 domain-containing protein n=1 Tax=Sphaerisporangium sp. NPDC051011 TaxID=3155792 RepID=UPI00340C567B